MRCAWCLIPAASALRVTRLCPPSGRGILPGNFCRPAIGRAQSARERVSSLYGAYDIYTIVSDPSPLRPSDFDDECI